MVGQAGPGATAPAVMGRRIKAKRVSLAETLGFERM